MKIRSLSQIFSLVFLLVFFTGLVCQIVWAKKNNTNNDTNYFYYADRQKVPLILSTRHIAICCSNEDLNPILNKLPDFVNKAERRKLPQGIILLGLKGKVTRTQIKDLLSNLKSDPRVRLVPLVFEVGSTEMIVTRDFIAKFSPETSKDEIYNLNKEYGVDIVKEVDWDKNTYILRVRQDGNKKDTALQIANIYHQLKQVIYAQPDFIRFKEKTILPPSSKEILIIGPNGERLPPDTKIPKGTNSYKMRVPISVKLPESLRKDQTYSPQGTVTKDIIKTEGFEGEFPNTWILVGDPTWGKTNYRSYSGSYSGYCVGSSVSPPGPYPNNVEAWMVYGPFDLTDAQDARVDLQAWIETEVYFDWFAIMASTDGSNFYGWALSGDWAGWSGDGGWMNISFDLKDVYTLGNLRGQPEVWIAFIFESDSSITYRGVYIDDVVIEKITGGYENLTSDRYDHLQWSLNNNGQSFGIPDADIDAPEAWNVTHGSNTIIIAIIDEGVDLNHPDLKDKLAAGYDATGNGTGGAPSGDDAHGTNCAGIAAAITDNSLGIAGVAWEAKIMPIRIAYGDGAGGWVTQDSWIADGINWAVNHGADVLSNSWAGGGASTIITNAIENAKSNGRNGKGAVVVFAAGNNNSSVEYPAYLSNVLAVGALSPCDERTSPTSCDGEFWWGSNYGPELDICAPGVLMYSTDIQGSSGYSDGDYYSKFNGTSSATPVVAGVAALILGLNPNLTATEVENILKTTADDLGSSGWDQYTGYGRVNAYKALSAVKSGGISMPWLHLLLGE